MTIVRPHASPARRKATFVQTVKAVAWSFFGVRGSEAHRQDMAQLNPLHVIAAGIGLAALFVLTLIGIVRWVVA